jgi:phosphonate utilization transcriptional regulator
MTARPPSAALAEISLLQNHSLVMLVQRELERMLLAGALSGGEKLNEPVLAARLGVSRGPVREAIRALAEKGLVRPEKNRGTFVREISVSEADEIFEVRASLDRLAGRKVAASIRADQLAVLREVVAEMEAAVRLDDREGYHLANLRFHDSLVEFSSNGKLLQTYRRLVDELSLFRRHSLEMPRRMPHSVQEHERILDLIAAGDVEATGEALYEHAMASRARAHELTPRVRPGSRRPRPVAVSPQRPALKK